MRLAHADALVMRGRILLERATTGSANSPLDRTDIERAGDDTDGALALTRQCGYAWAERDALALAADVRQALGDAAGALGLRRAADALSARRLADLGGSEKALRNIPRRRPAPRRGSQRP